MFKSRTGLNFFFSNSHLYPQFKLTTFIYSQSFSIGALCIFVTNVIAAAALYSSMPNWKLIEEITETRRKHFTKVKGKCRLDTVK